LWAEAKVRFESGSVWWLDTLNLVQLASDQQEARYEGDPWEEVIGPWLESKESTTISEVLEKMHQQAAGAMDADGQDSCRALSAGTGLAAVPGASRQPARMAVSEGCLRWKCSQCSQYCSQTVPSLSAMDSSSSQCSGVPAVIPIDAAPSCDPYRSRTRNTGNNGNRVGTEQVGLGAHVEQNGNTGNRAEEPNRQILKYFGLYAVSDRRL
jgi:hypothetical protein